MNEPSSRPEVDPQCLLTLASMGDFRQANFTYPFQQDEPGSGRAQKAAKQRCVTNFRSFEKQCWADNGTEKGDDGKSEFGRCSIRGPERDSSEL